MCGIAGVVGPLAERVLVERMADAQWHRGPDGSGAWRDHGVALAHRRLRIIDLTEAGAQPMSSHDGRFTLVYNGEVFNYEEVRSKLPPYRYRSLTDTEVILHAYATWGPACLERFVGMWGLAIWDAQRRELFCARDRLGIKPFHYAWLGQGRDRSFAFASEIGGLLAAGVRQTINDGIVYDFLAKDFYDHSDETFYSGVQKLPPATWAIVRADGSVDGPHVYWDLAAEALAQTPSAVPRERDERLLDLLQGAVHLHLRSDVPIGVALSGGLDSSMLLALLDATHPNPRDVEAFSFVTPDPIYSEQPFVEAMARSTGRVAHLVDMSGECFAEHAHSVGAQQQEPFAGAPIVAYALCFELARRCGFVVMMDGSGLDEAFGGYARFRPARWADLLRAGDDAQLAFELEAVGLGGAAHRPAVASAVRRVVDGDTAGLAQDLTRGVRPECLSDGFAHEHRARSLEAAKPFPDHLRNLMYRELRYTKLPRALRFRDRLSMAVGCELRPPFLDHRVLAYAFSLPPEDLIHEGVGKVILRRAARRLLPGVVRRASKRSVQTPQREWFRGELREWVCRHVDRAALWERGWLDRDRASVEMNAFLQGSGDNSFFVWQWLNLGWWAEPVGRDLV